MDRLSSSLLLALVAVLLVDARTVWVPSTPGESVKDAWDTVYEYYKSVYQTVDPDAMYDFIGLDELNAALKKAIASGATIEQVNTQVAAFVANADERIPGFGELADKIISKREIALKVKSGELSADSPEAQVLDEPASEKSATTPWPTVVGSLGGDGSVGTPPLQANGSNSSENEISKPPSDSSFSSNGTTVESDASVQTPVPAPSNAIALIVGCVAITLATIATLV
ncbi:hypothetical protein Poli38472_010863 [Pythium oligandrum]|uniref:Uncharacterized protein n=1 Tax=Pythium oligandrum TaxID=41045 RepID=A0A8K1FFL8_PYTOL|nr:hypothetical protein Poli38472_010863 [Pythium oligandrum]|eukprot:TMW61800.1 hypothetical protein Poli38472_010863 [Pythium oligandrum]